MCGLLFFPASLCGFKFARCCPLFLLTALSAWLPKQEKIKTTQSRMCVCGWVGGRLRFCLTGVEKKITARQYCLADGNRIASLAPCTLCWSQFCCLKSGCRCLSLFRLMRLLRWGIFVSMFLLIRCCLFLLIFSGMILVIFT